MILKEKKEYLTIFGVKKNNKQVLLSKSTDDGRTWSRPIDITRSALPSAWGWVGPGPGHGIQLRHGRHSGRLVIPAWAGIEMARPSPSSIE